MNTQNQSQGKENNKNTQTQNTTGGYKGTKKFMGGNTNLQGRIFEISAKDAVHQFCINHQGYHRLCWARIHAWRRYKIYDREL
jgi:hypothetical protein